MTNEEKENIVKALIYLLGAVYKLNPQNRGAQAYIAVLEEIIK